MRPVEDEEIDEPVPLVRAFTTNDSPIPVVRPLNVLRTCVPPVEAVEERSRRDPVDVAVSFEVEERRARDPPFAITDVV